MADLVVASLADSGDYNEWDVNICFGGCKTMLGTTLKRPLAEESRKMYGAGGR